MPRYVSLVKYSSEALQGVRADGYASRPGAMRQLGESLGVTIESVDFMLPGSEWDFMTVVSAPSADAVIAMGSFAEASGVIQRAVTYELFSGEQLDSAIAAASPEYSPPSAS